MIINGREARLVNSSRELRRARRFERRLALELRRALTGKPIDEESKRRAVAIIERVQARWSHLLP